MLVAYSTGLLSIAKVLSERELRQSVRATVAAIREKRSSHFKQNVLTSNSAVLRPYHYEWRMA